MNAPVGIVYANVVFAVNSWAGIGIVRSRVGVVFVIASVLIEIFLFELREPLVPGSGRVKRAVWFGAAVALIVSLPLRVSDAVLS